MSLLAIGSSHAAATTVPRSQLGCVSYLGLEEALTSGNKHTCGIPKVLTQS